MLNHGIPSYGYRIESPTTPGTIDVERLKSIGLYPGPKYQEVKSYDNFEYEGQVYNSMISKGQLNPDQLYPSLVIQNHVSRN